MRTKAGINIHHGNSKGASTAGKLEKPSRTVATMVIATAMSRIRLIRRRRIHGAAASPRTRHSVASLRKLADRRDRTSHRSQRLWMLSSERSLPGAISPSKHQRWIHNNSYAISRRHDAGSTVFASLRANIQPRKNGVKSASGTDRTQTRWRGPDSLGDPGISQRSGRRIDPGVSGLCVVDGHLLPRDDRR